MSDELTVYEESKDLAIARPPEVVLGEAKKAAKALKDVVSQKSKPVIMNGEQYLEFEDWQTLGRFYGVTAKITDTRFVDFGASQGFEAKAVALRSDGAEISAAEAMCLNDENNWKSKPLFQLRSMAQTRACAKALRNVLAWVVVLAGYKATPAEEMQDVNGKAPLAEPQEKKAPEPTPEAPKPSDNELVVGIVEKVTTKSGSGDKGPWTNYGIFIGGERYGTFSDTAGTAAQSLQGQKVELEWKQDGKYKVAVGITPAPEEAKPF